MCCSMRRIIFLRFRVLKGETTGGKKHVNGLKCDLLLLSHYILREIKKRCPSKGCMDVNAKKLTSMHKNVLTQRPFFTFLYCCRSLYCIQAYGKKNSPVMVSHASAGGWGDYLFMHAFVSLMPSSR